MSSEKSIIPNIPEDWRVSTVGDVCEEVGGDVQTGPFGSQLHAEDYVDDGIPVVMPKNIGENDISTDDIAKISIEDAERLSKYRLKPGDIVYARRGDVEKRALVKEHQSGWLCGTGCLRIRLGDRISSEYIAYYLAHPKVRQWIVQHAVGATMDNLNTEILESVPLVIPSLEEQRQIAKILGDFDRQIDAIKEMNQTLESISHAIFRSWFSDFDPYDEFKESEKGQIPASFEVTTLPALMEIVLGGTPDSDNENYYGGNIVWAKAKDVSQEKEAFISSTEKTITKLGLKESSAELLPKGTTVITARGTVGETALTSREMAANQTCYGLVPKDQMEKYFLFFLVRTHIEKLRRRTHGTVFDTINMATLREQEIILPPKEERIRFDETVVPLMELMLNNQDKRKTLSRIRNVLLPELISGELKTNDRSLKTKEVSSEV